MLIVTSCAFLIFNLPFDIYFLVYGSGAFTVATAEDVALQVMLYNVVNILSYTNNSINFFIDFICIPYHRRHYCFIFIF